MPNFLLVLEMDNSKTKQKTKITDMTNFSKEDFQATPENKYVMDFSDTQDIDDTFNIFQTKLLKAIDKYAPFKTLSQKSRNEKKSMDNKTNTSIEKNKIHEKYLKSKDSFWYIQQIYQF